MESTARGKFEGGDAAWEEERLGSYSHSEVRLVEIQEKLCSSVERGKDQVSMIVDVLFQNVGYLAHYYIFQSHTTVIATYIHIYIYIYIYTHTHTHTHTVCILH
jgi:hypothetical protein